MKLQKALSLVLALALAVAPLSTVAYAADGTAGKTPIANVADLTDEPVETAAPTAEPAAEPEETAAPTAEPTAEPEESPAPTAEPTAEPEETAAPTAEPTAEPEETAAPTAEPAAEPEETAAPTAEPEESPAPTDEPEEDSGNDEDGIMPASLLPIQEKWVYLYLNHYSKDELKEMTLATLLTELRDAENKPIDVPVGAKVAWGYTKAYSDGSHYWTDTEFDVLEQSATVDLSGEYSNERQYYLQIIVGTGDQLDYKATRYIVRTYISDVIVDDFTSEYLYWMNGGSSQRYNITISSSLKYTYSPLSEAIGIPTAQLTYYIPEQTFKNYQGGGSAYDPATSVFAMAIQSAIRTSRPDIDVHAYKMADYLAYRQNGVLLDGKEQDQFLTVTGQARYCYSAVFSTTEDPTSDNVLCLVYTDKASGKELACQGLVLVVQQGALPKGGLYSVRGDKMQTATEWSDYGDNKIYEPEIGVDLSKEPTAGIFTFSSGYEDYRTTSKEAYNKDWYYFFNGYQLDIARVFLGQYPSIQAAEDAEAEDVTEQLLPQEGSSFPYGYKVNFGKNQTTYFTVLMKNGSVFTYRLSGYLQETQTQTSRVMNDDYITGRDPWLNFTSASGYESKSFAITNDDYENHYNNLDTAYGKGYQTILINDTDVDLEHLVPRFTPGSSNVRVFAVSSSSSVEVTSNDPDSAQNFSTGPVQYTAVSGDHERNYQVQFVKKVEGKAQLFVNGPAKREVFLTNYFENHHDIMIANVGTEDLTGITVELKDATHVKLDDYWTINADKNNTLKGFTTTDRSSTSFGVLPNVAKIRLLPDGEGEIKGTLVISAPGQAPVQIELTGIAANPKIITTSLNEGVKYVPYSHVIATDNMNYDMGDATFSIIYGSLPEGVSLYEGTGELYGVPKESGTFRFQVRAHFDNYIFEDASSTMLTLKVSNNDNDLVFSASDSDEGYKLEQAVGVDVGGYDFVIGDSSPVERLFVSSGLFNEFQRFYLNGEELQPGVDYTAVSGSTRITIMGNTLLSKAIPGELNTLAAEFRVDDDHNNPLHRTAQNFRFGNLPSTNPGGSGGGNNGGGGSGSSSASGSSGSGSSGDSGNTSAAAGANVPQYATLTVRVVDSNNNGIAGMTVELHSAPRTGITNANGYVTFTNVPFGAHTLYIKNAGKTIASRSFIFGGSTTVGVSGDSILALPGGAITLTVRLKGNAISFVSAIPQTADPFDPALCCKLLFISGGGLLVLLWLQRKKRAAVDRRG